MKAVFEIEFESPQVAKKALQAVRQRRLGSAKAGMACAVNKSLLRATITAGSFAALRAISTSFMRDVRVLLDALEVYKRK